MFGNIKIILIFVPGLRLQPDRPGGFPVKIKTMARTIEFINTVEKNNGNNNYWASICHIQYDHDVLICFGRGKDEYVREYYRIHYSWKNAKRNMHNLTFGATKNIEEAINFWKRK